MTRLWTDGSLSQHEPQKGSLGFVLTDEKNEAFCELGETLYPIFSSFQAECMVLVNGLESCIEEEANVAGKHLEIYSDSQSLLRCLQCLPTNPKAVQGSIISILELIDKSLSIGSKAIKLN